MNSYLYANAPFYKQEYGNWKPVYVPKNENTVPFLMLIVEDLLKAKKLPPLGMDITKPPDMDWIVNIYFILNPNDDLDLFPGYLKSAIPDEKFEIDPRVAEQLEKVESKRTYRIYMPLSEERKLEIEDEKIVSQIKREEVSLEVNARLLEQKKKSLNGLAHDLAELRSKRNIQKKEAKDVLKTPTKSQLNHPKTIKQSEIIERTQESQLKKDFSEEKRD